MARQVPKLASSVVCKAGVLCISVMHALSWLRQAKAASLLMLCPSSSQATGFSMAQRVARMTFSVPPCRICFGWVQPFLSAAQDAQEFAVKLAGATADQDKARRLEGETRDLQAAHVHIEQVRAGTDP